MIKIKSEEEFKSAIGDVNESAVAVLFTAPNCAPCGRLKTKLEALGKQIFEVSSGDLRDLCIAQNVRSAPTFRIYKSGVISLHIVGDDPTIVECVESHGVSDVYNLKVQVEIVENVEEKEQPVNPETKTRK